MFVLPLFLCFYFVQFSTAFHGIGGLFGFVFGFQKLCLCRCGIQKRHIYDNIRSTRLLGGDTTTPHQFPWLAAVNNGSWVFGGSLISDRHVITAATPLYGVPAGKITVILGAHDRCASGDPALNNTVAAVILHPAYSPSNMDNDIALLRLRHVVQYNQYISPICLPLHGAEEAGQVAWTVSWVEQSVKSTCVPRVATLPILNTKVCLKGVDDYNLVTPDKGCLGPLGAKSIICTTDVGAPVMTRWSVGASFRLTGIMTTLSSCDKQLTPLYTRVIEHIDWIQNHIRADCQCF